MIYSTKTSQNYWIYEGNIMDEYEKNETIKRYNERLEMYGDDPRSLGWLNGRQHIRFKVLSEIADLNNCTILDLGCGFGDLCGFLKRNYKVDYTGYDINNNLLEIAKKKYPDARFDVKDILMGQIIEKFDYIISSGVFNFRLSDNTSFTKKMLKKMFEMCDKGVAVDFITDYVDYRNEDLHYTNPEDMFSFCKTLSKRVTIRNDYMPFEFCVYIYKNDSITVNNAFAGFEHE